MKTERLSESKIRDIVNKWSQSIPHHDHRELGSKMKIESVSEVKFYKVIDFTQFERRSVTRLHKQFDGSVSDNTPYLREKDVEIWSYEFNKPPKYCDKKESAVIAGSKYKDKCFVCVGLGCVKCPKCRDGNITCFVCKGTGDRDDTEPCYKCKGKGNISVQKTIREPGWNYLKKEWGSVDVTKWVPERCLECSGSGKKGIVVHRGCRTCRGNGEVSCENCSGSGKVTCSVCYGNRNLLYYLNINADFKVHTNSFGCSGSLDQGEIGVMLETVKTKELRNIAVIKENNGKLTSYPEPITELVKRGIVNLLEDSHKKEAFDNKILFEQIDVYEADLTYAKYVYQDDYYTIAIVHDNNNTVIADESPIKNTYNELLRKSVNAAKLRQYSTALSRIRKCRNFPHAGETEERFEKELIGLMSKGVKFGLSIGLYLSWILMSIIGFFYYYEHNHVLKYFDFTNDPRSAWQFLSLANILITILVANKWIAIFGKRIPQKLFTIPSLPIRILVGASIAVAISVIASLMVGILNFVGLTIPIIYPVFLFLSIMIGCIAVLLGVVVFIISLIWKFIF